MNGNHGQDSPPFRHHGYSAPPSVRGFAERANNIVHWSEMERGGHFPAIEAPDLLADDLRTFYARLT